MNESFDQFPWRRAYHLYRITYLILRKIYKHPPSPRTWCRLDEACELLHAAFLLRIRYHLALHDPGQSLDILDLVGEAWKRFLIHCQNKERFRDVFQLVNRLSRDVVIDAMRRLLAEKRGKGNPVVSYNDAVAEDDEPLATGTNPAPSCCPACDLSDSAILEQIAELIAEDAITDRQKIAFISLYLEDIRWEEIAARLGCCRATIYREATAVQRLLATRFS